MSPIDNPVMLIRLKVLFLKMFRIAILKLLTNIISDFGFYFISLVLF